MALFTDGSISTIEDLHAYDSPILDLASTEGVDLSAKLSIAADEIGTELEEFLRKRSGQDRGAELSQVVVTPALKQWHTLHTLSLLYGDIHSSHVSRRFEEKWKDYRLRGKRAAETLYRIGVGVVFHPIAKAAPPDVTTMRGGAETGPYCFKVSWTDCASKDGCPSDGRIWMSEEPGSVVVRAIGPPSVAVGYHVYAGQSEQGTTRQTATPVALEREWIMPAAGLVTGPPMPSGQEPDLYIRNDRVLQRG